MGVLPMNCKNSTKCQSCISILWLLVCLWIFTFSSHSNANEETVWSLLQQGKAVALVRHAIAPGNGDPSHFSITDCSTQRNLSEEGHQQARQIGDLVRKNGIAQAEVFTSQWCRCVDTANGFDLGFVEPLPFLNSFYQDRSTEGEQTDSLLKWITLRLENPNNDPHLAALLVTHQVNITGLTGVFPSSGELVFVGLEQGKLTVFGTVETR